MTGDIGVTDPKRILNGSLPQLTPVLADPKGRFFGIGLSNNNLSGSIPANFGDSLGHFNVSNNPLLSGPLPQSVTNSIGQWTGTRVCRLENTQLCVPATWAHEPSCIRDTALALPVCGGTTPLSIDPSDPNAPASRGWWIFNGSFNQIVGITFLFAFIVMLMWGLVLWRRRNLAMRSREESDYTSPQRPEDIELNARRADELNLPMYEPPAPAYAEGSTVAAAAAEAKKDDQK
ncbi:hypothetical protein BCR33DRAFT_351416 [Rhizoclosmatium globosum]|uniref:L domain-like protein n=1 Tax=Rhizoclosmatium globosum TaxID=329046 RepID=A0A1Y2C1X5_9FUNG|nr:hypothetical protein BCR33DRAFT_351416 [Rhizoclosmatium globosum]|eukprot:ORY41011.1 hypothetical protein BCR33DRAFT_351416 [Rhizoclosmatium globosum]